MPRNLAFWQSLPQKIAQFFTLSRTGIRQCDFARARRTMVDSQVRPADVTDLRIIAAMLEVPRERFVAAVAARPSPISTSMCRWRTDAGRVLLKPMVFGQAVAGRRHQGDRPRARCRLRHRLFVRRAGAARGDKWWRWRRMRRSRAAAAANACARRAQCHGRRPGRSPPAGRSGGPYDVILLEGAQRGRAGDALRAARRGGRLLAVIGSATHGEGDDLPQGGHARDRAAAVRCRGALLPGFVKPPAFVF